MATRMIEQSDTNMVHSVFIRYDRLKYLIDTNYTGSDATCINLIFDLGSLLYHMRNMDLERCGFFYPHTLSATIINMVSHYRSFFRTRFNVDTKIYILFSNGAYKENLNKDTKYATSKNYDYFRENSNILSTVVPYIEDVWYSGFGGFEPLSKIMEIVEYERVQNGNNFPWLLLTKDIIATQLLKLDDFFIIRPRKDFTNKGMDTSYIINRENYIGCLREDFKAKTKISYVPVNALGLLFTLTRVQMRGIPALVSLAKASQIINTELLKNTLTVNLTRPEAERLCREYKLKVDADVLLYRHWYVDATCIYSHYQNAKDYVGMMNLYIDRNNMLNMFSELFPHNIIDYLAL